MDEVEDLREAFRVSETQRISILRELEDCQAMLEEEVFMRTHFEEYATSLSAELQEAKQLLSDQLLQETEDTPARRPLRSLASEGDVRSRRSSADLSVMSPRHALLSPSKAALMDEQLEKLIENQVVDAEAMISMTKQVQGKYRDVLESLEKQRAEAKSQLEEELLERDALRATVSDLEMELKEIVEMMEAVELEKEDLEDRQQILRMDIDDYGVQLSARMDITTSLRRSTDEAQQTLMEIQKEMHQKSTQQLTTSTPPSPMPSAVAPLEAGEQLHEVERHKRHAVELQLTEQRTDFATLQEQLLREVAWRSDLQSQLNEKTTECIQLRDMVSQLERQLPKTSLEVSLASPRTHLPPFPSRAVSSPRPFSSAGATPGAVSVSPLPIQRETGSVVSESHSSSVSSPTHSARPSPRSPREDVQQAAMQQMLRERQRAEELEQALRQALALLQNQEGSDGQRSSRSFGVGGTPFELGTALLSALSRSLQEKDGAIAQARAQIVMIMASEGDQREVLEQEVRSLTAERDNLQRLMAQQRTRMLQQQLKLMIASEDEAGSTVSSPC